MHATTKKDTHTDQVTNQGHTYETRRNKGAPDHGPGSKFHPNVSVDTSVVSFINEKPGTSDIK